MSNEELVLREERERRQMYDEEMEDYRGPSRDFADDGLMEKVREKQEQYRETLIANGYYKFFKDDEDEEGED